MNNQGAIALAGPMDRILSRDALEDLAEREILCWAEGLLSAILQDTGAFAVIRIGKSDSIKAIRRVCIKTLKVGFPPDVPCTTLVAAFRSGVFAFFRT
jgi:hypothetical protein